MAQIFENPLNGYREEVSDTCSLWVALFGMLYLMYKGLWAHVFIWFLLVSVPAVLTGGVAIVLTLPLVTIGYALSIRGILRSRYLRKGWKESDVMPSPATTSASPSSPIPPLEKFTRKCPSCAEDIKIEAIRCRFCQSDVT